jgi:hypothetical protein
MPCSTLKVNQCFGGASHPCLQGWRVSQARNPLSITYVVLVCCLAYFSTLEMEVTWSSEMSVDFQQTMQCYIPEDRNLHNYLCENCRSYSIVSTISTWFIWACLFFRLPGLLDILKGVELSQELIVSSFIKLFRSLCCGFGKSFTRQKVLYYNYLSYPSVPES